VSAKIACRVERDARVGNFSLASLFLSPNFSGAGQISFYTHFKMADISFFTTLNNVLRFQVYKASKKKMKISTVLLFCFSNKHDKPEIMFRQIFG